jgi:hypothetical protein
MPMPEGVCPQCLYLAAAMRSAQMEAGAFCREVVARTWTEPDTTDAEARALEAYARWNDATEALKEHIGRHPRIQDRQW